MTTLSAGAGSPFVSDDTNAGYWPVDNLPVVNPIGIKKRGGKRVPTAQTSTSERVTTAGRYGLGGVKFPLATVLTNAWNDASASVEWSSGRGKRVRFSEPLFGRWCARGLHTAGPKSASPTGLRRSLTPWGNQFRPVGEALSHLICERCEVTCPARGWPPRPGSA